MKTKLDKLWGALNLGIKEFKMATKSELKTHFPDQNEIKIEKQGDRWVIRLDKPAKFSDTTNKIDIFISGEIVCSEIQENGSAALLSYNTVIAYYKTKGSFNPIHMVFDGYHFDMDENIGIGHPVFHAQRKPSLMYEIISEHYPELNIDAKNDDAFERNRNFRLPTPQLDLYSAILMVVANHGVTSGGQMEFIKLVDKIMRHNPVRGILADQGRLQGCIDNSEITVDHWYAAAET